MARTIAELSTRCDLIDDRLATTRAEIEALWTGDDKLIEQLRAARDEIAALREEIAVLRHRADDVQKRAEEWGRRAWAMIPLFLSALLALASGLIVALVRR